MTQGHFKLSGTLAVVGGGRMGEAIIKGLLDAQALAASSIVVAEPLAQRRDELGAAHGVRCVAQAAEAAQEGDIVLLAVKPQVMDGVLDSIADAVGAALVVSIAAGITCARLESHMPAGTAVVRVMPNTPAMVGEGMSVISGGAEASTEQVDMARELFSLIGKAIVVDEHAQDAATAISGAGPAYMALFIDALARAGVRQGLPRSVAENLAIQTMFGTAKMLDATGMHPEQLIDAVSSPGGTTIAAIEQFEAGGLRATVFKAVEASVKRAKELGQ